MIKGPKILLCSCTVIGMLTVLASATLVFNVQELQLLLNSTVCFEFLTVNTDNLFACALVVTTDVATLCVVCCVLCVARKNSIDVRNGLKSGAVYSVRTQHAGRLRVRSDHCHVNVTVARVVWRHHHLSSSGSGRSWKNSPPKTNTYVWRSLLVAIKFPLMVSCLR